jgi:ElaB/YqjD/DUF883 family membrane-anchored ribosome-binding protein
METKQTMYSVADTLTAETNQELDRLAATAPRHLRRRIAGEANFYSRETDRFVREQTWKAIGIAMSLGVLTGLLLHRR